MNVARQPIWGLEHETGRVNLYSPTAMPKAAGFLWNQHMMLQMNCRGYAIAHHMQPEPAKYSRGPSLEAATFMQPEHHYYACHPGRFFYVKDETGELFSLPYEPVRKRATSYVFSHGKDDIQWSLIHSNLRFELKVSLLEEHAAERWSLRITNMQNSQRRIQLTPYFSIGFMSWMNQSASYDAELNAIVADSVTPYQKTEDYQKQQHFKDMTYLLSERQPDSWLANQAVFEGEGGLSNPDALKQAGLPNTDANYSQPAAAMQYQLTLSAGKTACLQWLFGPAKDKAEIYRIKQAFDKPASVTSENTPPINALEIKDCPDDEFAHFVNHWLPRQVRYHAEANRLTTDPQTRNFLQDSMGGIFMQAESAKTAFLLALSQQSLNGDMPDGILLHPQASLKYINQIPHSDHNVWLVLFLSAYLRETNDWSIFDEDCAFADSQTHASVFEHIQLAMQTLFHNLDKRNLSLIHQGDWCDPMNMVGYQGKGVSAWLSMASAYVFKLWAQICVRLNQRTIAQAWQAKSEQLVQSINRYFWTGSWYARGITDNGRLFGCPADKEGRIFLNAQSWAMLCGAANANQIADMLAEVDAQLDTPFGPMLLAPAYTRMQEDIGRLTQKFPGTAENGSVYNHACAYFAYSLFQIGASERAFNLLKSMLVCDEQVGKCGQLPVYIPNYYRGAYYQHPEHAGLSSHLFNTGTVAWYYMCVIEELFGLKGDSGDLLIQPQLPNHWKRARVSRKFSGAQFDVFYSRKDDIKAIQVSVNAKALASNRISDIQKGATYQVAVALPLSNKPQGAAN